MSVKETKLLMKSWRILAKQELKVIIGGIKGDVCYIKYLQKRTSYLLEKENSSKKTTADQIEICCYVSCFSLEKEI